MPELTFAKAVELLLSDPELAGTLADAVDSLPPPVPLDSDQVAALAEQLDAMRRAR